MQIGSELSFVRMRDFAHDSLGFFFDFWGSSTSSDCPQLKRPRGIFTQAGAFPESQT